MVDILLGLGALVVLFYVWSFLETDIDRKLRDEKDRIFAKYIRL